MKVKASSRGHFKTVGGQEGSYSVSSKEILLRVLFPGLLDSRLHGTLKNPQLELQKGMEISLQNASVASQDLGNNKVFSLFHSADVLLTESIEKRKTILHRIVEFKSFAYSLWSEIMDTYL